MALLRACAGQGPIRASAHRSSKLLPQQLLQRAQAPSAFSLQRQLASRSSSLDGATLRAAGNADDGLDHGQIRLEDIARQNKDTLRLISKEMKILRKEVKKLSLIVEQDFVGYRRSTLSQEDSSAFWRSSLQGPDDIMADPADPLRQDEVRPSVRTARLQPKHISEMGHSTLAALALQKNHSAHRERLIREIMSVDNCSWEEAHKVLSKMDAYKERHYWFVTFPYRLGIVIASSLGIGSIFLVFHPSTANWYGTRIAGEELPEGTDSVADMSINQVGTWTWSWMEPMIGTASFVLLCAQFVRAQLVRMNMKPFLAVMESRKAGRVAARFPQYDQSMIRVWAKPLPKATNGFPIYERTLGIRGPSSGL